MKRKIFISAIAIASLILLYLFISNFEYIFYRNSQNTAEIQLAAPAPLPEPKILYGYNIDSMLVIENKVKRNESLSTLVEKHNTPFINVIEIANLSKPIFDVRKIRPGKQYTLICFPDSLKTAQALIYEPNKMEYIVFNFHDSLYVNKFARKVDTIQKTMSGIIDMSLAVTVGKQGGSPQLTNDIVDVLAWQIDFFRLQKGDKFKVIYNELQVDGKAIGIGKIRGAFFNHFCNDYYAYHFDQGNGIDYFDEEGNSLRKAFLKYPLDFTRISSRYSGARYHPVQKRWKAHRGTDFAAPKGTPIKTVGDGIISEARFSKYNGYYVKVKHNATYSTQYLHMSKIAKGIKPGVKVKQSQVIGYVGKTGLATGNHLCYRFWKNGVQIDALKVKLPPSEPIHDTNIIRYKQVRDSIKIELDNIEIVSDTAYPGLAVQ